MYPRTRLRRGRRTEGIRRLAAEVRLAGDDLILPVFATCGAGREEPVQALPGVSRRSVDKLVDRAHALRTRALLVFGVPEPNEKGEVGSAAWQEDGTVPRAVRALKADRPDLTVITDVCLCAYTSHGHCGFLEDGQVVNDASVEQLAKMALNHAQAGVDIVSPSDMMDGRVGAIRSLLDAEGFTNTAILAYSAKYASTYYGPFRDACDSAPQGDRKTYQMDPRNGREAVIETLLDLAEGADMVMVKPALAYLDIIRRVREEALCPVVCYNVSGEDSLVKNAAAAGLVDEAAIVRENLMAFRRAGSDIIITYHGREALTKGWI